jgi:hypothetical protein
MWPRWPSAGAQLAAAHQPRIEALQQLGVELAGLHVAKPGQHVQPDQVLVPFARRLAELRDFEPLGDRLPNRDGRLGMSVLVDLVLELRQRRGGLVVRRRRLAEVSPAASERVDAGVDDGPVAAGGELFDVAARSAAAPGRHGAEASKAGYHNSSHE